MHRLLVSRVGLTPRGEHQTTLQNTCLQHKNVDDQSSMASPRDDIPFRTTTSPHDFAHTNGSLQLKFSATGTRRSEAAVHRSDRFLLVSVLRACAAACIYQTSKRDSRRVSPAFVSQAVYYRWSVTQHPVHPTQHEHCMYQPTH